jgi:hypothetical protein
VRPDPPPTPIAIICPPSPSPALVAAACAWLAALDPRFSLVLSGAHRPEGGPLADELHRVALERDVAVVAWHGEGGPDRMAGVRHVAVFGDAEAAERARRDGKRVREWDAVGVMR